MITLTRSFGDRELIVNPDDILQVIPCGSGAVISIAGDADYPKGADYMVEETVVDVVKKLIRYGYNLSKDAS